MAIFINVISRKRVLDAGQLFSSSHVWNDRPSFHRKILHGESHGRLFPLSLTFDHLYLLKTKSRKIIPNVARSIISIGIENAHLFINRTKIRH